MCSSHGPVFSGPHTPAPRFHPSGRTANCRKHLRDRMGHTTGGGQAKVLGSPMLFQPGQPLRKMIICATGGAARLRLSIAEDGQCSQCIQLSPPIGMRLAAIWQNGICLIAKFYGEVCRRICCPRGCTPGQNGVCQYSLCALALPPTHCFTSECFSPFQFCGGEFERFLDISIFRPSFRIVKAESRSKAFFSDIWDSY